MKHVRALHITPEKIVTCNVVVIQLLSALVKTKTLLRNKSPNTPSVLVATSFIRSPDETALRNDADFQNKMAQALHQGLSHLPTKPTAQFLC